MNSSKLTGIFMFAVLLLVPITGYSVQVTFYLGDVLLLRNGKKVNITMGTTINSGDLIKTGKSSTIEIAYKDGSKITMQQNSSARIGTKSVKGSDNVSLISGNITGKFSKFGKGKKVHSSTITCAIRGTEFKMGVSKGGESRIDLSEGKLDIKNPYGKVKLKQNQKVESDIGGKPKKGRMKGSVDDWKNKKDDELKNDPEGKSEQYSKYMDKFKDNSNKANKDMDDYGKMVKDAKGKKSLEKAGSEIENAEDDIEDEMMMNEAANGSISGIMENFQQSKSNIYNEFKKIKEESNKVLEVQRTNLENIRAIKEEYKKNYKAIMDRFKEDKKKIMGDIDFDNLKPKFDKDK